MAKTRTSRAIAGTITSFLQYALLMALQFALAPVILRTAGQEVLGGYSFLMQAVGWTALTDLGFGVATSRYLAQANGIDDQRKRFRAIFTTSRTFYLGSNGASALLILVVGWKAGSIMPMSPSVESQARLSLYFLAIWVAVRAPVSLYANALIATQNLAAVNMIVALGSTLRLLLSLLMVVVGAGLVGLMIANIVGEFTTFMVERARYRKLYPRDQLGWGIPDRALFREMFGFGLTYMVAIVAGRLSASTDSVITGYLSGAAAASIYYTSQMPGTILYQLLWKLTDNAAPALNELYGRRAIPQLTGAYLRLLRYSLLLVIPLAIGLIGFNRHAITLWVGQAQYAGALLTVGLAAFAITQVVSHLNAIVLVAYGDVRVMGLLFLCSGVAKVILAFGLGKAIGLGGVMLANALADIPVSIYLSYRVYRMVGLRFSGVWLQAILPSLRAGTATVLVLIVVLIKPPGGTWLSLFLWVSVFTLAWIIGIVALGLASAERGQLWLHMERMFRLAFGKANTSR